MSQGTHLCESTFIDSVLKRFGGKCFENGTYSLRNYSSSDSCGGP